MSPEEIVKCIDFRYITDVLTPEEALEMLREQAKTKEERIQLALNNQVRILHACKALALP